MFSNRIESTPIESDLIGSDLGAAGERLPHCNAHPALRARIGPGFGIPVLGSSGIPYIHHKKASCVHNIHFLQ